MAPHTIAARNRRRPSGARPAVAARSTRAKVTSPTMSPSGHAHPLADRDSRVRTTSYMDHVTADSQATVGPAVAPPSTWPTLGVASGCGQFATARSVLRRKLVVYGKPAQRKTVCTLDFGYSGSALSWLGVEPSSRLLSAPWPNRSPSVAPVAGLRLGRCPVTPELFISGARRAQVFATLSVRCLNGCLHGSLSRSRERAGRHFPRCFPGRALGARATRQRLQLGGGPGKFSLVQQCAVAR